MGEERSGEGGYQWLQVASEEMDLHMPLKEAYLCSGDRDRVSGGAGGGGKGESSEQG